MKITSALILALMLLLAASSSGALLTQEKPQDTTALAGSVTALESNKPVDVTVTESEQFLKCFSIKVLATTKSLNIATAGATADIDLLVCVDEQPKTLDDLEEKAKFISSSARFNEVLTIDAKSEPKLRAGVYYIFAGSLQAEGEAELTFTLAAALDSKPTLKPAIPAARELVKPDALQRAIDASVRLDSEVSTGSATVISPTGLLLTCYHVIEKENDYLRKDIFVSFTLDPRRDPVQSHLAETVFANKELDLAVLRIVSDIDGNPVSKPSFAWVPLGDVTRLSLDEDLRCLGYPGIGGPRSIYGITVSRGIVSGFIERKGQTKFIKTDALISAGNSGGGAFNTKFELVGVPTEAMHADQTMESLGYLRPVSAIPETWMKLIREEMPK